MARSLLLHAVNPCCSFPCQHNGVCVADLDGDSYTCDCTWTGYYGTNCEIRMVQIIIVQCYYNTFDLSYNIAILLHKPDPDTSHCIIVFFFMMNLYKCRG